MRINRYFYWPRYPFVMSLIIDDLTCLPLEGKLVTRNNKTTRFTLVTLWSWQTTAITHPTYLYANIWFPSQFKQCLLKDDSEALKLRALYPRTLFVFVSELLKWDNLEIESNNFISHISALHDNFLILWIDCIYHITA